MDAAAKDGGHTESRNSEPAKSNQEILKVEDVTDQHDTVYDADAESQLPYECEEIESESDDETRMQTNEASLITGFRALHCGNYRPDHDNSALSKAIHTIRKRTHSQMLSDSDEEGVEPSRTPTPSFKRPKKRLRAIQDRIPPRSPQETDDVMDVDYVSNPVQNF